MNYFHKSYEQSHRSFFLKKQVGVYAPGTSMVLISSRLQP